jgi:multidrug efflux system membrane fusion protein
VLDHGHFAVIHVRIHREFRRRRNGRRDGGACHRGNFGNVDLLRIVDVVVNLRDFGNVDHLRDDADLGYVGNVRFRLKQRYRVVNANDLHNAGRRSSDRNSVGIFRDRQPWGQLGCSGTDDDRSGPSDFGASSADHADSFISAHGDNHNAVSDHRNYRDYWNRWNHRNVDRLLTIFISETRMAMKKKTVVAAALVIAAVTAGGFTYFRHAHLMQQAVATPGPPPAVPIVAGTVTQHDVPIYLSGVGTVIAYNTDIVRAQIQGQIMTINFTEGQTVHAGDLLAQIDPRPYQALIDQYTGNLERDQAQLINAQSNLTRYTTLGQKGWATPQLVETQKAQVGQLQAAIKADQALIDAAKVQLSFTRLTSPIDGVAGIRQIDVGNIISPSTTNGLVVITQIDPISLIFTLPETNLPQIQQQQQKTRTPLAVLAYSQDDTTLLDQGVLGLVNNEILQTTGSIQLKANFANKAHKLWPGELVNARLLVDTRQNGLTVSASAVQQGPSGAYVYVINSDNTVATRPVKVAEISEGQALVDSGLKANEQVVVDGQYKLQPGTRVTMLTGQAAQEAIAQTAQQAPIP